MGSQGSRKGSAGGQRVRGSDEVVWRSWGHRAVEKGHREVIGSEGVMRSYGGHGVTGSDEVTGRSWGHSLVERGRREVMGS